MNNDSTITQLSSTAAVHYLPGFISRADSEHLLELWKHQLDWIQSTITMFGKKVDIPRLNAWYGERAYAYSGTHFDAKPWTAELHELKVKIEQHSGLLLNSVLVNWYRDGQDCMGWHSDDEACLGAQPQIASLSLGDTRKFVLRNKKDKSIKHTVTLDNGSLLLMLGDTQSQWQHSLPRTKKSQHSRINLTYRLIN